MAVVEEGERGSSIRVKINCSKSKIVRFRRSRKPRTQFSCTCQNSTLEYLGVYFDEFLKFSHWAEVLAEPSGRAVGAIVANIKTQHLTCSVYY